MLVLFLFYTWGSSTYKYFTKGHCLVTGQALYMSPLDSKAHVLLNLYHTQLGFSLFLPDCFPVFFYPLGFSFDICKEFL